MTRSGGGMQRRRAYNKRSFKSVVDRFHKTGSVHIENKQYKKPVNNDAENIEKVRELITRNAGICLNQMALELNLSKSSIWRILWQSLKFYSNRIHLTT